MIENVLFSQYMIERAGNKSLMIFLKEEAELFEKTRMISGSYAGHDEIGLYIEKKIQAGEAYITFLKWDSIIAVTNDINQYD
jgi:hypothetical protein